MQADTDFDYLNAQIKLLRDKVDKLEQKIDNTPKPDREEGYYWVKHECLDGWEPARYYNDKNYHGWVLIGLDSLIGEDELIEIGPRSHPPEE